MLEKLITNLKKSLPGGNKNDEEVEEESVEETEESETGPEQSAEDEKKKKTSMLIKVVVIIGLGYLAVDHFFLSANNEPNIDQLTSAPPKRRRKPKLLEETAKTADAPKAEISAPAEQPQPEPVPESPPLVPEEPVPPVESINIADKAVETETDKTVIGEIPEKEAAVGENNLDQRLDQLIDNVEQKEKPAEKETNLAEKIVEEETYTAPPDYDVLGRGLVYNCKDKYWACIDKPGYVNCGKNMKWNKSKGNAQECVVQNVYSTEEDCIKIQKYNVSTNQDTQFCQ